MDGRDLLEQARLTRKIQALAREVQRLIDAYQQEVIELAELQERASGSMITAVGSASDSVSCNSNGGSGRTSCG